MALRHCLLTSWWHSDIDEYVQLGNQLGNMSQAKGQLAEMLRNANCMFYFAFFTAYAAFCRRDASGHLCAEEHRC